MSITIEDGTGTGLQAKVTANNRLKTTGVDLTLDEAATETGDTYNLSTGIVSLTTSAASAIFYIKNNETNDLHLTSIIVNISNYVGTDGQPIFTVLRNPTAGTIISTATDGLSSNRNFGSQKTLDLNLFKGVDADTLTGDVVTEEIKIPLPSTAVLTLIQFDTLVIVPKGSSVGFTYQPPSGITSVDIIIAVTTTLNGSQL